MQSKKVFFGRTWAIQVKCPSCEQWQFWAKLCGECGERFPKDYEITEPNEYRSPPTTWRDRLSRKLLLSVYKRDDYICQYCARQCYDSWVSDPKQLTIDHLLPHSGGGSNDIDNLITSCRECNSVKGNKHFDSIEDARRYIRDKLNIDY
jgi:5-methylcytosine-specific restriction endonuclease McrA